MLTKIILNNCAKYVKQPKHFTTEVLRIYYQIRYNNFYDELPSTIL